MLSQNQAYDKKNENQRRMAAILLILFLLLASSCICSSGLSNSSDGKYSRKSGDSDGTLVVSESATFTGISQQDSSIPTSTPGRLTQMIITRTPATATGIVSQSTSNSYNTANPTNGAGTARPTATRTPQPTMTWFIRYFPTRTPLVFPTRTPTRTRTPQPTYTASKISTSTSTPTLTHTATITHTPTLTEIPTLTPTPLPNFVTFSVDADSDGTLDILIMNPDGSGEQIVLQDGANTLVCDWSPDGDWLVYEEGGNPLTRQLYRIHLDGSSKSILIGLPEGNNSQASWSPDGNWFVFRNIAASGQIDLYLLGENGSGLLRLTNSAADERYPDWSPDGNSVIFVSDKDGSDKVYSVEVAALLESDPPAPPEAVLWVDPGSGIDLAWPRWLGEKLVFSSNDGLQWDISVVDLSAPGTFTNLTNPDGTDTFNDSTPAWSRDGSLVLFISDRSGVDEIYSVSAAGGALNLIENSYSGEWRPNWLP